MIKEMDRINIIKYSYNEIFNQTNLRSVNLLTAQNFNLVNLILAIAALISALTVIVHFIKKSNDTVNERIRREAKEVASEEAQIERERREQESKFLEERIDTKLRNIETKIDKLMDHNIKQGKKQDEINYLLKQGHIETWKNDIRTIYYNLRDTGSISDVEKSYVDKIYHLYKDMGGNSDIDAKYAEMVTVYTKRLEESYDEAFKKQRNK